MITMGETFMKYVEFEVAFGIVYNCTITRHTTNVLVGYLDIDVY